MTAESLGPAALLAAALSLTITAPASALTGCPDASMVQSARIVEFETMMMVVSLRCKHIGVQLTEHNEQLVAARHTMFEDARFRVQRFVRGNEEPVAAPIADVAAAPVRAAKAASAKPQVAGRAGSKALVAKAGDARSLAATKSPAATRSPAGKGVAAKRPGAKGTAAKDVSARPAGTKPALAKGRVVQIPGAQGPASAATTARAPTAKPQLAGGPAAKGKAAAPRSRRGDPFDQYLTRVGSLYGMGSTTPDRCRQFDEIALALADRTSPDRLLTSVAAALVEVPLLQKLAVCPG